MKAMKASTVMKASKAKKREVLHVRRSPSLHLQPEDGSATEDGSAEDEPASLCLSFVALQAAARQQQKTSLLANQLF